VDQRERWQALQSHLGAARASVDAGDREKALEAIDAALAIDPDFLAAHSLRDCILAPPQAGGQTGPAPHGQPTPAQDAAGAKTNPAGSRPVVSVDGYAKFEARAKRRRVDRRIDAARVALDRRRLKDAAVALDEIIELDPNLPELSELTTSFDELRRAAATAHRGPWFAAAASFAIVLFGASWLQQTRPLASIQTVGVSMPVAPPPPTASVDTNIVEVAVAPATAPVATSGADVTRDLGHATRAPESTNAEPRSSNPESRVANPGSRISYTESRPANAEPRIVIPDTRAVSNPDSRTPSPGVQRAPDAEPQAATALELLSAAAPAAAPTPSIMSAVAPAPPTPVGVSVPSAVPPRPIEIADEVGLVKQALQRYRTAYDGLDAPSAQAVYPAVNQAALARAFDGLESQTLTFDACDVQLRGEAAIATCHGSARYVPKVGSREPRIEPRTWTFSLRKAGTDWKIDSARAER
jgi:tetratricopeptide (TPR) repeat protein